MLKVLIVDDDPHINELLQLYFLNNGFETYSCETGTDAVAEFHRINPDVVILDIMLPGKDGFEVLREIRRESAVPIIMLTARGEMLDRVVGLELGADDYVPKPFEPPELIARVKAVLRRSGGELDGQGKDRASSEDIVHLPDLIVDKRRYTATINGVETDMPPKELELLFHLASHPNRVFTREQLLESIWGYDFFGDSRTVDVHIKRVREKLDVGEHPDWQIKTVWGVGYKFELKNK